MRPRGNVKALALECLVIIGLLVFSRGFLPPTRTELGFSTELPAVEPKFQRVIFMVVDAMRSDFVYSESKSFMPNTHKLIRDGFSHAFTAFSDPPTVTLPRIKGLTTGASPNFLDAVINIAESDTASTLQSQDSWIHQLKAQNKTLHMFGDDTWLKLFPDTFDEFEGTSSFYVADFTEVDNNVTRHLPSQLSQESSTGNHKWDALILHYLGLDHIGHKGGPESVHMPEKLEEMDAIVKDIFDSLDDQTLLVLAGDHGMNEVGNHGGASNGETSAALAFFSKRFRNAAEAPLPSSEDYSYYSRIYQVDLVPTLAILLGFPVPKNSLGVFIEGLLPLWDSESDRKTILEMNGRHLDLAMANDETWDDLRVQQRYLMRTSSQHNLGYMIAGVAFLTASSIISGFAVLAEFRHKCPTASIRDLVLLSQWLILPLLYFIGMFGSSTVEEEHYIWYWGLSSLLGLFVILLPAVADKFRVLILLSCFRVIRGWKSAGQKWAALNGSVELLKNFPCTRCFLIGCALIFISVMSSRKRVTSQLMSLLAATCVLAFKYCSAHFPLNLPWMLNVARTSYIVSLLASVCSASKEPGMLLLFLMQSKTENLILWVPFFIGRQTLIKLGTKKNSDTKCLNSEAVSAFVSLLSLCFEYSVFFAVGGSNSLATIDLSNAYNGVSGYNIPLVALLTYLGNWGPSLFWALTLTEVSASRVPRAWFYSIACTGVTLACLLLREHLFIWTVFSPKLLYVGAWLVFHEVIAMNFMMLIS
nr:GPI7 [Starmerella bombicola]